MTYGYIRVSTDKQTVENQRFEIQRFCDKEGLQVNLWVEETVSGAKTPDKRLLGALLDKAQPGDLIVCSELSRLGRNLLMIMSILNQLMERKVRVWTIKDNFRLGDDIQSKVLAFAFGLSAEIERQLIRDRTREALALKKASGVRLGRPKGPANHYKLSGREKEIVTLMAQGYKGRRLAEKLHVSTATLYKFLRHMGMGPQ